MNKFDNKTIAAMRSVLDEVCSHIPRNASSARTFVAARILECASGGEQTYDSLLAAGRRAVLDQFGNADALKATFR